MITQKPLTTLKNRGNHLCSEAKTSQKDNDKEHELTQFSQKRKLIEPDAVYELFEERAAIREYDGQQSRIEAEAGARNDVLKSFDPKDREALLEVFRTLLEWSKDA